MLRHTVEAGFLRNGADIRVVQKFLGSLIESWLPNGTRMSQRNTLWGRCAGAIRQRARLKADSHKSSHERASFALISVVLSAAAATSEAMFEA